jgi:tetratricopeptide (TPR) repeat protein
MIGRAIVAIIAAGLMATQVVRNAAVASMAGPSPEAAAQFWSFHPATEISFAMTRIALAARGRHSVPSAVFTTMSDAAAREPLAPEPYLVRGVQAELSSDGEHAQQAFEAAQWRDPRSLPAAYFLADRYFRAGDVDHGLEEIAALARLSPNGNVTVAPYLAVYGRNPANWPVLRTMFRANPQLADSALLAMASNMATAPAVLALADAREKPEDAHWLPALINTWVAAGQYAKAHAIWSRTAARAGGQLIYDASFSDTSALPPFNWALTSSGVGLAERQPGGRLHVVFYGQEDGILASELLLLAPGEYRLSMQLLGDAARARILNWSVWCDKGDAPVASVSIDAAAARGWQFTIPSGCAAQWLRLSGASGDLPQQVDVTVSGLKLEWVNKSA